MLIDLDCDRIVACLKNIYTDMWYTLFSVSVSVNIIDSLLCDYFVVEFCPLLELFC